MPLFVFHGHAFGLIHGFIPLLALFFKFGERNIMLTVLISLPGTIAHELVHLLVGMLLFAHPSGFTILPKKTAENHWQLGSVAFANIHWLNALFIGLAPLALAPLAWWLSAHIDTSRLSLRTTGYVLATASILQACIPSWQDVKVSFISWPLFACAAFMGWFVFHYHGGY